MALPLLSYPDAARLVAQHAAAVCASPGLPVERVDLPDAYGRVLAAPVHADRDQPPFPRSTRDGYACCAADLASGVSLAVAAQIRAGQPPPEKPVASGQAIEIMTGAPVPPGADAVVMLEHVLVTDTHTGRRITLDAGRSLRPGENVVPAGSEARRSDVILSPGVRLTAAMIGAAAACGAATLQVFARPRVAIVATGDELVRVGEEPLPHQIRNSNSYSLAAQVSAAGGNPVRLPIARDNRPDLDAALLDSLAQADLLLLSGGVSAGSYDLVEPALAALRAEFFFTGVRIQPGKPVVFGRLPADAAAPKVTYFLGLPGNPVSTMVTFLLFAAPLLRALGGEREASPRFATARLASELRVRTGLTRFLPARLEPSWDSPEVHPVAWQGSGDLAATARSNCFLVVPPDCECLAPGTPVSVLLPD